MFVAGRVFVALFCSGIFVFAVTFCFAGRFFLAGSLFCRLCLPSCLLGAFFAGSFLFLLGALFYWDVFCLLAAFLLGVFCCWEGVFFSGRVVCWEVVLLGFVFVLEKLRGIRRDWDEIVSGWVVTSRVGTSLGWMGRVAMSC